MSDIGGVTSYAATGLRLWSQFNTKHGPKCGCLVCADTRAYLGREPLVTNIHDVMVVPEQREDKAS